MPTDPQIAEIAAGLSEAQRDALFGRYSWESPMAQEEGEAALYRLGIWGPYGGRSDLANAIRNHLLSEDRNDG